MASGVTKQTTCPLAFLPALSFFFYFPDDKLCFLSSLQTTTVVGASLDQDIYFQADESCPKPIFFVASIWSSHVTSLMNLVTYFSENKILDYSRSLDYLH